MNFMHKRFLILFLTLILSVPLFAQLEVKKGSFKEVPGFVNINSDPNYQNDDNDLPFAVIKVRTENITDKQRRDLHFESNLAVGIMLEYKTGEVWVYLTAKYADYLKISHPDFSSYEYALPLDLQPKKGYEMTLVNKTGIVHEVNVYNYLVITADQPNAAVYIDDVYAGEQFAQKSFMAGEKHIWRIECELYHTESGEAVIPEKEGQNITIEKTLHPAFGYLNVTSSPENGAIVYIDGKKVGQTPYQSERLASGEHKVRVMKEMYSATEQTFTITDGNTAQAAIIMTANFVNVTVTTDSESDIYIDNELKGKGTWSGRLDDGNHAFEARKASHRSSVENIKLTLGKDENIVIPNPTPIYGTLDVSTNPIGANIIIDGKSFGTTPRVLTNVLVGNHELRLEKMGCSPVVKNITLDNKNKLTINEKLPTGRNISISTDETGDKIFVDGSYIGDSPLTATMSFGEHEIIAIRGGSGSNIKTLNDVRHVDDAIMTKQVYTISKESDSVLVLNYMAPTEAANGLYSIGKGKQVYFSKGNLQYQASTNTWRFAEHQWSFVGALHKEYKQTGPGWLDIESYEINNGNVYENGEQCDNRFISSTYSGWIDLFGWGTSGWNSGAKCYQPYSTSEKYNDYYVGDTCINSLTNKYANADWGVYNKISNGGDNNWRTLSDSEWCYVLFERETRSGVRYAIATVNGVKGLVLLPDNWDDSLYKLNDVNLRAIYRNDSEKYSYDNNIITLDKWEMLEANGAVFLPACGNREGNEIFHNNNGYYWSTTSGRRDYLEIHNKHIVGLEFSEYGADMTYNADNYSWRCDGYSVRLVTTGNKNLIVEFPHNNSDNNDIDDDKIYLHPEKYPYFTNGGTDMVWEWYYIQENIKLPQDALDNDVGERIFVEFVVEKDGSLSNIHVLNRMGYGCDDEAVRLVHDMPKWVPGTQDGKPVRTLTTIGVDFYRQGK
jgi:hypothetical protein